MERKMLGTVCVVFILGAIVLRVLGLCNPFDLIQEGTSTTFDVQGQQHVSVCFVAILMIAALGAFGASPEEPTLLKRKKQFSHLETK